MNNISIEKVVKIKKLKVKPFKDIKQYLDTGGLNGNSIQTEPVTFSTRPSRADQLVLENQLIVARMKGTNKVLLINNQTSELIVSTGFFVLEIQKGWFPRFLFHFFRSSFFQNQKDRLSTGATQKAINNKRFKEIVIPELSYKDQKNITDKLDKIEMLHHRREMGIQLLNDYLRSIFLEMFGDPINNPYGFNVSKLSQFYKSDKEGTKCGPFGSALKKEEYVESGIPVWTMDNIQGMEFNPDNCLYITQEKFIELKMYGVVNDDIIISRAGTVGKMAIISGQSSNSIISTNLIKLTLNKSKLLPIYFLSLMNYCKGRVGRLRTGSDGAFTHMNTGVLDNLSFPIPPIDLQTTYEEIVNNTKALILKMITQQNEIDNHFNSLLQSNFGTN